MKPDNTTDQRRLLLDSDEFCNFVHFEKCRICTRLQVAYILNFCFVALYSVRFDSYSIYGSNLHIYSRHNNNIYRIIQKFGSFIPLVQAFM